MTLQEAIDAGIDLMEELAREGRMDEYHKVRLLIEAGKRLQQSRLKRLADFTELLPGETEE